MQRHLTVMALSVFALVSVTKGMALAGGDPAQACASSKIKAASKKQSCLLGLEAKEAQKGTKDPAKVQKCRDSFSGSFSKADAKGGCASAGDAASVEALVDGFVASIDAQLSVGGTATGKCQSSKIKAAGKKASCLLGLAAKAVTGGGLDSAKVAKCQSSLSTSFSKADAKGGCGTSNDAATIEASVDDFVDSVSAAELPSCNACDCGTTAPTTFQFTTGLATGNCGSILNASGSQLGGLACSGLYIGGALTTLNLPVQVPDYGSSITKVSCCNGKNMRLTATSQADTGSIRNCSKAGCLYGPPLPIPNVTIPGLSVCVINEVATDADGSANCADGQSHINIPLTSVNYLTGDILPKRCSANSVGTFPGRVCTTNAQCGGGAGTCDTDAATKPCPICNPTTNVCNGGPNDGVACTPGTQLVTGAAYPTSHDCPPPSILNIGGLPIPYALTTGVSSKGATASGVFCGYCRDADDTNCFQGDPDAVHCPAGGNSQAKPCSSNADCGQPFESCEQRDGGAFTFAQARVLVEIGTAAGDLSGHTPKNATLGSVFCIPPSFNGAIDSAANIPGPGAASLPGQSQLQ